MINFLVYMGIIFSLVIILSCISALVVVCKELIARKRYHYMIKHRFDKPPTAECYCIDCRLHGEDNQCFKFNGWRTADEWFCWDAEPKDRHRI